MESKRSARQAAVQIIQHLRENGHIALLAGGCVRDTLLGHRPKDYDVATDAIPPRVIELFRKTRQVGAQFGVVLVKQSGVWVEVATFRSDHDYRDGRHPTHVTFGGPIEDAQRRDFTINGMFFDPVTEQVIDYVGGQKDLREGVIRTIGPAEQRFAEDHLRLIRAVRFSARFGYHIEPETHLAIRTQARLITRVSAERIRDEFEKILADPNRAGAFAQLEELELLSHLWPESDWNEQRIALTRAILAGLPEQVSFATAMAAILIHWPGHEVGRICRDLTCSNDVRKQVVWLVENHAAMGTQESMTLADLKTLMRRPEFDDLLALTLAWLRATHQAETVYERLVQRARAIPHEDIAPPPLLTGADLIELGLSPGPRFKQILDQVYRAQLEGTLQTKDDALNMARQEAGTR